MPSAGLMWLFRSAPERPSPYSPLPQPMTTGVVTVLTPEPIVALFKNGLGAELLVHPSAEG